LFRVLTGRPAYDGKNLVFKMLAHREQPIPSLCAARPDVSAVLDSVFQRMLAKNPQDRFQSMTEVIRALEACQSQDAAQPVGPVLARPTPINAAPPAASFPTLASSQAVAKHRRGVTRHQRSLLIAWGTALAVVALAADALWLAR
jgi:serine/threonine protein kinase